MHMKDITTMSILIHHPIPTFSKQHWDDFFKDSLKTIEISKSSNILEIGCNDSYLLKQYKKYTKNLYGIDASEKMVNYSKKILKLNVFHNLFDEKIIKYFRSKNKI